MAQSNDQTQEDDVVVDESAVFDALADERESGVKNESDDNPATDNSNDDDAAAAQAATDGDKPKPDA